MPVYWCCLIVIVVHEGVQRVLDGNHCINRWVSDGDTRIHDVNIHTISGKGATLISLYRASGSGEIQLLGEALDREEWTQLRNTAVRLLRARRAEHAARLLEEYPFALHEGTNSFGDEFSVLYLSAPMAQYVDLAERERDPASKASLRTLAEALSEIGPYVRFIAVALDKKEGPAPVSSASPQITSDAVEQALKDAEQLIASRGATSGVDRVHTAFHGFLLAVCKKASLEVLGNDPGVTQLFKAIRERHPAFGGEAGRKTCSGLPAPWQ